MSVRPLSTMPGQSELQSSPCLQGERVAFTGTLASMTHAEAAKSVEDHGGTSTDHVSRQTTMLVVGEEGWPLDDDGQPSAKLRQVERWQRAGVEVRVLSESDWLSLLGLADRCDEIRRLYTPAMLSSLLNVSVHVIRGWARQGLIRPVKQVCRLPYFDFREVNSARRLCELLEAGVPRHEIEESLRRLPAIVRGDERPLEQLELLVDRSRVVVRDTHGLLVPHTGQRLFDFEKPKGPQPVEVPEEPVQLLRLSTADLATEDVRNCDWLVEGCRLYDAGRIEDALEAFRLAAMDSPNSADVHFQLGECLYRLGNVAGSLERYYMAVEHDHDFLEAWTQIGCLHREQDEFDEACRAFRIALEVLPDYPDAHFHLAETLHTLGESDEASVHWREYLLFDSRGPWADIARQRLDAEWV